MKIQKKNLVLIFAAIMFLSLSCGSSNVPNTENTVSEEDAYVLLREPEEVIQKSIEDLSGKVITISEKEFIELITDLDNPKGFQYKGKTPCVIDLYTDWCKPCVFLGQVLNEIAPEYQGKVIFYKLNIEQAQGVAIAFNVKSIPKLLYFKPRGEISSTLGYLDKEQMKHTIDEYLLKP